MNKQVCLITGGNSGIGRETAAGIARQGISVVIISRDYLKGKEAVEYIKRESGNNNISFIIADLSSQKQIHNISEEFRSKFNRLDILINNAGAVTRKRELTVDGTEYQLAVNHLAPFLLTNIMIDLLIDSAPSRIVNISSQTHRYGHINLKEINSSDHYDPQDVYASTKLMNILFTYKLAGMLKGTGVTVNCLHPGVVNTKLLYDYQGRSEIKFFLSRIKNDSVFRGSATSVYLAVSDEVSGITGKYFVNKQPKESSPASYDKKLADRLWEVSSELTGVTKPSEIG